MAHEFELIKEITLEATPEEVWEAVATGAGIDGWFMGRNQVEPREGGRTAMTVGGDTAEATVTAWEPPRRFTYQTGSPDEPRFIAFEWLVEGRGDGTTVLRLVQSGVLGDDDWEAEYDAWGSGWEMYLHQLGQYLRWFRGRPVTPVTIMRPGPEDPEQLWPRLRRGLGLAAAPAEGDRVRLTPDGLTPVEGVVDYTSPDILGVRSDDGLYRFIGGLGGMVALGHHLYAGDVDAGAEEVWQAWLDRLFSEGEDQAETAP
jgi:uncharacterized protein YndB with AHSA1/START domain